MKTSRTTTGSLATMAVLAMAASACGSDPTDPSAAAEAVFDALVAMSDDPAAEGPVLNSVAMTTEEQVRLLLDRAAISDLLVEFARTLDERDCDANTTLYLPDGVFEVAGAFRLESHEELARTGSPQGLGQYAGTWHLSANHAITVDNGTATSRSYLLGVHLLDNNPFRHADGAGWYGCTLRCTPEGWRFASVKITEVWRSGERLTHVEG